MKTLLPALVLSALAAFAGAADGIDEAKLAAGDFVRVTIIDREKKQMAVYTPTAGGDVDLPRIGSWNFVGLKPSEFAGRIKAAYVERGFHAADTLNVLLEYGPPPKPLVISIVGREAGKKEVPWKEGLTLQDAVAQAGLRSNPPNLRAYILRSARGGREIRIRGSVWGSYGNEVTNPKLQPGDTIVFEEKQFYF